MKGHGWMKTGRGGDSTYWKCRACGLRTLTFFGSEDKDAPYDQLGRMRSYWMDGHRGVWHFLSKMACTDILAWQVHEV